MLLQLHIENIAVIEETDISFAPGFNALTGETGAGKSIVIDAMGAVLGGRTSRELIRTGAQKAFVAATFVEVPAALPSLVANGLSPEEGGVLLLQREIFADGKNSCRVGGRPVTVAQLREIGAELLNIHGQHDGQQLLDEEQHILYLDAFGRCDTAAYAACFAATAALRGEIRSLRMDEAEKARKVDSLRFQIDELERAELREGEEEILEARRSILRNSEKFLTAVGGACGCLSGDEDALGAVSLLKEAHTALSAFKAGPFAGFLERLQGLYSEAMDVAESLRDMQAEFDFSPEELDALESRGDQLYRLKKKYGASVGEMLTYLARCRAELDAIETADDRLARLEKKLEDSKKSLLAAGALLTAARRTAAKQLEKHILQELHELDMNRVRFSISIIGREPAADGCDEIRFLMSANAGEDLKPIQKIASGGELARIMLALKNVLAEQDCVATLVFDEVDTGVSGRAAQKVAEKLAKVSRKKQVLCVTHLPQLAAMADTHFSVEKGEKNGRTYTGVVCMTREQRMQELARIVGGAQLTDSLLQSADELLTAAEAYKATL